MKTIVVLDIPDAAAHTAVALVERVNGAVRNFREIACVEASVHRISPFTDVHYADNVKRLYGAEARDHVKAGYSAWRRVPDRLLGA
jgi:hypothetical protein